METVPVRVGRVGVGQAAKVVVAGLLLVRLLWLLWLPLLLLLLLAVVRDVLHVKVGGVLEALARCRGGGGGGARVSVPLRPLLMGLDVLVQVVRAGEPLAALRAHEPLLPGVGAQVALQLVRAREGLVAEDPAAGERALARVPAEVRLEVAGLAVHLAAAGHVAHVLPLLVVPVVPRPAPVLAVGALAPPAPPRRHALGVLQQRRRDLGVLGSSCSCSCCGGRGCGGVGGVCPPQLGVVLVVSSCSSWGPLSSCPSWARGRGTSCSCSHASLAELGLVVGVVPGLVVGVPGVRGGGGRGGGGGELGGRLGCVVVVAVVAARLGLGWRRDGQLQLVQLGRAGAAAAPPSCGLGAAGRRRLLRAVRGERARGGGPALLLVPLRPGAEGAGAGGGAAGGGQLGVPGVQLQLAPSWQPGPHVGGGCLAAVGRQHTQGVAAAAATARGFVNLGIMELVLVSDKTINKYFLKYWINLQQTEMMYLFKQGYNVLFPNFTTISWENLFLFFTEV